jgi:hypothetical protein
MLRQKHTKTHKSSNTNLLGSSPIVYLRYLTKALQQPWLQGLIHHPGHLIYPSLPIPCFRLAPTSAVITGRNRQITFRR